MGDMTSSSSSRSSEFPFLSPAERRIFALLAAKGYLLAESENAATHGPASAITYSISFPYDDALRRHDSEDLLIAREVIEKQLRDR
jgi:hypothetical protein